MIQKNRKNGAEMMNNQTCTDCAGPMVNDFGKGEAYCGVCGLTVELALDDADTNSSHAKGEGRTSEAVNSNAVSQGAKHGGRMNPFGDLFDANGVRLSERARQQFIRMSRRDLSTQRDSDPMYQQLYAMVRQLFGDNMARFAECLIAAATRQLTEAQEATRKTLTPSEQRRLKCPKTSIMRKANRYRGDGTQHALQIMALAIASLAYKHLGMVRVNEKAVMTQYNITKDQLKYSMKTIHQNYMMRVQLGWAWPPQSVPAHIARQDEYDAALEYLEQVVADRFDARTHESIMKAFHATMTAIGEPDINSPTSNVPVSMVAACVLYALLTKMGLHEGHLSAIAAAVGRSGAGVKNRLEDLQNRHVAGEYPEGKHLMTESKKGSDVASEDVSVDDKAQIED